jgi:hypothetical protein
MPLRVDDVNVEAPSPVLPASTVVRPASPDANSSGGERTVSQPTPIDDFIACFMKLLESPVLNTPILRRTRPKGKATEGTDTALIPKRSARLAAKSVHREANPKAQARKVMMKRAGIHVETELPDQASFEELHMAFKGPFADESREAMEVLFTGRRQRAMRSVCAA